MKFLKRFGRVVGILVIVLLGLLVVIRLVLPTVAVRIANKKLPKTLNTRASLRRLDLGLLRGYLALHDLRIVQPAGFGEGNLLSAPELRVKVKLASLLQPPLTIEEIVLNNFEINIIKNQAGELNTAVLFPPISPVPSPPPGVAEETPPQAGAPSRPLLLGKIAINELSFSYTDSSLGSSSEKDTGGKPLQVRITPFDLLLTDLLVDPAAEPSAFEPASACLTANILQEPFQDALLGISARIGPLGKAVPTLNACLRLIGLELKPLDPVVPPGTASAIGGDALDLAADLSLSPSVLDCKIEVKATGGHTLSLVIGGTPDQPEIDTSAILFSLMLRAGGGVGNLVGNLGGAGMEVAGAAVDTAETLGQGAVDVVGSIGGGLFKTVTSVAKGDIKGAAGGLKDATVGSVEKAAGTVTAAGGELANGAVDAGTASLGMDDLQAWRESCRERWTGSWKEAQELVRRMPFPPLIPQQKLKTAPAEPAVTATE